MSSWIRVGAFVVPTLTFALSATLSAEGSDSARKRFEREYPAAAARTERVFSRIQGKCRRRLLVNGHDSPNGTVEGTFALDGDQVLVTFLLADEQNKTAAKGENVYCASENTFFHVVRLPGSSNFRLESIGSRSDDQSRFVNVFGGFFGVSFQLRGRSLRKLMASSDFEWGEVTEISRDGKPMVNVRFKTSYETGDPDLKEAVSLDLDPELNWSIQAVEIHPSKNPQVKLTFNAEYGTFRDGVPMPKLVRYQCVPIQTQIMEFDTYSFEPTASDKFTLARFGLAEAPSADPVARKDWTLYRLAALAGFGLVAAFVLKRLADRQRSNSSSQPSTKLAPVPTSSKEKESSKE